MIGIVNIKHQIQKTLAWLKSELNPNRPRKLHGHTAITKIPLTKRILNVILKLSETKILSLCYELSTQIFYFLLSSLPAFPLGLRWQQLEFKPPHITVFHHFHHFALVKSQAIPSKILNVIGPCSLKASYWSSPICFCKQSLFGESF